MKEKITQFSRGNFEFELPNVILSEEQITVDVEQGSSYQGCFTITTQDHVKIKGLVYSSSRLLSITDEQFYGEENVIGYKFSALGLRDGDEEEGIITCVTSMGEFEIPFHFRVTSPYCLTKNGEIKDLCQFTNLAKEDPVTALSLFKSDEFVTVFLNDDIAYRRLYDSLIKSTSASQAMEEFLVAIHKKLPVTIDVDKKELNFEVNTDSSFMEKIYITRSEWGYSEIKLYTDVPFIGLDHKVLWTDNFTINSYPLEVVIDPSKMRAGINYGRIIIKTVRQTIIILVTCKVAHKERIGEAESAHLRRYELQLTKNYLNFRMNKIDLPGYIRDTSDTLSSLTILDDDIYYDLVRTHLYIISDNHEMAKEMLTNFSNRIGGSKSNAIAYCAYQYLNALYTKDKEVIDAAVETIKEFYNKEPDWRILWFLLYLDKKYDSNKLNKLRDIRKICELGCKSPIMYYEACLIYNSDPSLLHEIGDFERAVLNWGAKEGYINQEVIIQYAYLAAREKTFSKVIYHTLVRLYNAKPMTDILYAICALLIKSEKTENKYFEWYRLGVEAQLKLTSLHEYYMYAINDDEEAYLSHPIYLYYIYNSNLSDSRKAFLYAQIIRNKVDNPSIYNMYTKQMERFMYRQLQARQISRNLAVIYNDLLPPEKLDETVASNLSVLMYYHEVTCYNPNIKGVCVVHKELENEIYHPLKDGKAVVPIFTENAQIFLIDNNDNRYYETIPYEVRQLMDYSKYAEVCFVYDKDNPLLILNLSEFAWDYSKNAQDIMMLYKLAIQIPNLQAWCYKKFLLALIKHYYDHYDGELLDAYLKEVNMDLLTDEERIDMMEYMIMRDLTDKAMESIGRFGCSLVATDHLHKLCLKEVLNTPDYNETLVYLCHEVFKTGKYQEAILEYLVKHFKGSTTEMLAIWKEAHARGMDLTSYEERLLGQVLFTENHTALIGDVYLSYYQKGDNRILIRGFITYYAYQYLLKDLEIEEVLFSVMKKEITTEENEFCNIALIKYYSTLKSLKKEEVEFVDFQVHRLMKKGIVMPFYKDFKGKVALSEILFNKYYVMYRTSKDKNVMIHYYMDRSDDPEESKDYITEQMHDVFEGIYVKEFMLFSHEELLYYITEDSSDEEKASDCIEAGEVTSISQDADTKFDLINLMITSYHKKDEKTLIDTMKQYVTQSYIIDELLKPL